MLATSFGHRLAALLLLTLLVGVGGCGQKGDLYIPDEPESRQDLQAR
ncbi:MAG: lipoprotein [Gammaproteobacteria bacterium]